jgi:hypothetical protein
MMLRLAVFASMVAAVAALGPVGPARPAPVAPVVHALPVPPEPAVRANEIGGLSFSTSVNEQARPVAPAMRFSGTTLRLWISFNYYDYDARTRPRVRYVIRANGEEWQSGDLTCCEGTTGRYAFPIERERDRPLGGAGYQVSIYVGDVEASRGEFVVLGTGGFDNDNNDNGNNNGFGPRGIPSNSDNQ